MTARICCGAERRLLDGLCFYCAGTPEGARAQWLKAFSLMPKETADERPLRNSPKYTQLELPFPGPLPKSTP